eukprot:COSAG01_NODE_986_length_12320_cov_19.750818_10_plen_623_part_00
MIKDLLPLLLAQQEAQQAASLLAAICCCCCRDRWISSGESVKAAIQDLSIRCEGRAPQPRRAVRSGWAPSLPAEAGEEGCSLLGSLTALMSGSGEPEPEPESQLEGNAGAVIDVVLRGAGGRSLRSLGLIVKTAASGDAFVRTVRRACPQLPAQKAGVRRSDVIIAVNGESCAGRGDCSVQDELERLPHSANAILSIRRDGGGEEGEGGTEKPVPDEAATQRTLAALGELRVFRGDVRPPAVEGGAAMASVPLPSVGADGTPEKTGVGVEEGVPPPPVVEAGSSGGPGLEGRAVQLIESMPVHLVPYGVLGTRQETDTSQPAPAKRGGMFMSRKAAAPAPVVVPVPGKGPEEVAGTVTIVDPAGLRYIHGENGVKSAGGASRQIYTWLGINRAEHCMLPEAVRAAMPDRTNAKAHVYPADSSATTDTAAAAAADDADDAAAADDDDTLAAAADDPAATATGGREPAKDGSGHPNVAPRRRPACIVHVAAPDLRSLPESAEADVLELLERCYANVLSQWCPPPPPPPLPPSLSGQATLLQSAPSTCQTQPLCCAVLLAGASSCTSRPRNHQGSTQRRSCSGCCRSPEGCARSISWAGCCMLPTCRLCSTGAVLSSDPGRRCCT